MIVYVLIHSTGGGGELDNVCVEKVYASRESAEAAKLEKETNVKPWLYDEWDIEEHEVI